MYKQQCFIGACNSRRQHRQPRISDADKYAERYTLDPPLQNSTRRPLSDVKSSRHATMALKRTHHSSL